MSKYIFSIGSKFIIGILLFFCLSAKAQIGGGGAGTGGGNMPPGIYMVRGVIMDSASKTPLNLVSVDLYDAVTEKVLDGKLTDSTGRFGFRVTKEGKYYVVVSPVGFNAAKTETFELGESHAMHNLGNLQATPVYMSTGTVLINVEKPLIENKIDRLVYNASDDITNNGSSATELLRKVPMVEVDMDGNVSIRGSRNIKVLINGKPSAIVANSIKDALMALPADQIDKVEVITNPSAKYDAEGTAGIINIIMKEAQIKGTGGNIHAGVGNRSANLGLGLTYQKGKTGISFRMGGHFWRNVGDGYTKRINQSNGQSLALEQISNNRSFGGGPRASFGLDHEFNKFNAINFSLSVNGAINDNKSDWKTYTGMENAPLNFAYGRNTLNFGLNLGYDASLNYSKTYKKKDRELGVSLLYSGNSANTNYSASQFDQNGTDYYREKSQNKGLNNEYSLQVDFTEPVSEKLLLEAGSKLIFRTVTSDYHFDSFNFASSEYKPYTSRNNEFYYDQNVYGGYGQAQYGFNKNLSLRVGARYEYTTFGGGRKDSGISFRGQSYQNVIPYLLLNRKIGFTGFVKFGFTSRLQRPSLFYLNPYTNFSDPRNLTTGNPRLQAEISNNFELSAGNYTQKGGGSLTFYHRRIDNAIETIRTVDSAGIYQTTYGNVGKNRTTGLDLNINKRTKKYRINFNGGVGYVQIWSTSGATAVSGLSNSGITYSAGMHGSYEFAKGWQVQAFARFNAPVYSLQGRSQSWYFHTIGVKRRFKNDKGGIGIGIDNPLTPHVTYVTRTEGPGFTFYDRRGVNMFGFKINFDYKFGKIEVEQIKKKELKTIKNDDLKQGGDGGQQGGN